MSDPTPEFEPVPAVEDVPADAVVNGPVAERDVVEPVIHGVDNDEPQAEVETETVEVELYKPNDGIHGRDGGPYLDQVEAALFEQQQAAREGVEPDYENPRGYAGIVLRNKQQQVDNYNPTILAGDEFRSQADFEAPVVTTTVQEVPVTEN